MKRFLLTLIVSLAFCGSILAQSGDEGPWNPKELTSYWDDFDYHAYMDQKGFVAAIAIDGVAFSLENGNIDNDDFEYLEVAAFTEIDDVEQCRGNLMFLYPGYVEEYGDPYPTLDGVAIYYTTPGNDIYFKMYDHKNNILYTEYTITYLGEPVDVVTGEWYTQGWDDPENPIILNFISPASTGFELDIAGYGEGEGNYYLIATPVGPVNPSDVDNMVILETGDLATYDLYYFDQAASDGLEWINYQVSATEINNFDLVPGKGYLYANQTDVTLKFNGEGNTDLVQVELAKVPGAQLEGWNLVGNPYGVNAYIDRDFYIMNPETGADLIEASGAIDVMQGIFVLAAEDGETLEFSTEEISGKSANLALNLSNGRNLIDRAVVRFGNDRQLPKFQLKETSTKVYIPKDNVDYAIVNAEEFGEMPVNFKAQKNGSYTISFANENVDFNYLHLIDNLTGNDVNLLETPSYSFDANIADFAARFKLVFATGNASDDNFAFYNNGNLVINSNGAATLQIVDVLGRIVSSQNINGSQNVSVNAAAGVYTVQLIQGDNVKTQKIVVE